VSSDRITEHTRNAVVPLLQDDRFTETLLTAESVQAEVQLADALGFNGRVDLVVDGVPYDLKTAYRLTEQHRRANRFQLRIYLFALLLESLGAGERIGERLSEGVSGVLVYPNLKEESKVVFEEVELRREHVEDILRMRNEAATLRDGFGVPTTYGRDCEGCSFKSSTEIGSGQGDTGQLPPPCQFYCQSERRWACFETDDSGEMISQCPLFSECEERLDFRDPKVTDHYNELRTALNSEREARQKLGRDLDRLDEETLTQAGLRIPDLELLALKGRRRLVFTSTQGIVPGFRPGSRVRLAQAGTEYYTTATYYGRDGDQYVFQLSAQPTGAFLAPDATFEAVRTVSTAELPRDLLSQLDYAQRAEVAPVLESTGTAGDAVVDLSSGALDAITDHVHNKELYIDVPTRSDRTAVVTDLVSEVTTTRYPRPRNQDEPVPTDEQRVLVLCASPRTVDRVETALAETTTVARMDGFAGGPGTAVDAAEGSHEVYTVLRDASVIVSSIRYALSENVFHAMESGDPERRRHSSKFFDSVVLVGAERLSEPQFHFLQILGDRVVAIGDTRRHGPELVSGEAHESRLSEAYFNRLYRRFANIQTETSRSLRVAAEISEPMAEPFADLEVDRTVIDGQFEFIDVGGEAQAALGETALTHRITVDGDRSEARFLRLRPVDVVDTLQIADRLDQIRMLDASELTIQNIYTIEGIQYEVVTNNPIDADRHEIEVNVPVQATPYLNRRLTHNESEAEAVADVCAAREVDVVVTPFVAHANAIRTRLTDVDAEVPVRLPKQLDGQQVETAVVSLAVAGDDRIVRSPASDVETLYTALNAGCDTILVGDRTTLERNSVLHQLVNRSDSTK
jgi:CRISPR/Cas system-associated exonuclease Cas4 (RecB family)